MDKPTLVFSRTLLLISSLIVSAVATSSYAQYDESIVDSTLTSGYTRSGSYFNRQLGTALRFGYQTEGYGTQKGIVTLGSMKVFNMDGATLNLDAQATLSDDFGAGYNAGIFYRALNDFGFGPDSQRINGIGFWSDGQNTNADNFFNQLGVTLESLGDSYDLRVQGNFPLERTKDSDPVLVPGADPVYVENFLMSEVFEFKRDTSLTVVDFEAAKRVMNLEAWAFLAGYHLSGGPYDATGYRAGVRGYAVPDLAVSLQVTDDDIYHTNVVFGITWFVGRTSVANQPCGNVLDRFREPVQRNPYIATVQQSLTDATTPFTDATTGDEFFFIHVDDDTPAGTGDGTYENPYSTLAEAETGSDEDNIILVHSDTTIDDVQFTAKKGQRILGEGTDPNGNQVDHLINTAEQGLVVLPETDPNAKSLMAPIINGIVGNGSLDPNGNLDPNAGISIFTLADDNEVNNFQINGNVGGSDVAVNANNVNAPQLANLDINGPFLFGVAFTEVTGNSLIENSVTIDGTTEFGIYVNGGDSTVGANATVTNTAGRSVLVENRQGGTLTFGEINDTGLGILARNNTAGNITFSSLATLDTGDNDAVTLLNNNGSSITFQELQANSTAGDTFVVKGGGTITVNDDQGDGSDLTNDGDGSVLVVRGDDVDPNFIGSPTVNIAGDLRNDGDGYVADIQQMDSGGVLVSGNVLDPNGVGMGILIQENSGGTFSFTGETEILTGGTDSAVTLRNNSGAMIGFTQLQATSNDADTFRVIGGGTVTVSDPNDNGFINNTGSGSSLFVLGPDDPNGNAVGNPNVTINPDIDNEGGGYAVDVQHLTGGMVDVNGDITDDGADGMGIRAWENSSATIRFDGTTTLDTGVNTAVSLRNNATSTISFNNLKATSTTGDTFVVQGGGMITVNDDPNDPGLIENTGTGSAVVVVGPGNGGGITGNPTLTIDPNVANSGGGHAVDVTYLTGGTVDLNGNVVDTDGVGMGIIATNNTDATINFDGFTNLSTGASTAVELRNNSGSTISFGNLEARSTSGDTFVVYGRGTINVADPNDTAVIENSGSGSAFVVRGNTDPGATGNPDITILADINNTGTGNVVDIQDVTNRTIIVTGEVNDVSGTGEGMHFEDNSGGMFAFAGTTNLDTGANNALTMLNNEGSTTSFSNLKATAAAGNTVDIQGGGRVDFGTDPNDEGFINNTGTGTALFVRGNANGDPNITIVPDITNSVGGRSVDIQNMDDGTVVINGLVTDEDPNVMGVLVQGNSGDAVIAFGDTVKVTTSNGSHAVQLANNTGADISFNGLDVTVSGGGKGFTATGGGNLAVLNTNPTTIQQDGDGTALELRNMTISAAGAEFDTVNVTNGTDPNADAIVLKDLVGTGQVVVGSGTDPNDGGQITTDAIAIRVDNVNNLAVSNIRIDNSTGQGIDVTKQKAGSSATFTGMEIDTTSGTGINVHNNTSGTVSFSDVAVNATTTGDAVVNQSNNTTTINYTELTAAAVDGDTFTINGGGNVTVNDTGDGSTITNTGTGSALVVTGANGPGTGNPTASIAGEITNSGGGRAVDISGLTGGSVTVSADVTDTSDGMLIENNTSGTIAFSGNVSLTTTGATDAVTIQNNGSANSVTFNASSQLDIETDSGTGVVALNSGTVSILGSGNTIDTNSGIGVDIDNSRVVTIENTTIDVASASDPNFSAVDIDHTVAASMDVNLNSVTITTDAAKGVDIFANSTGELDVVMDTIDITTTDPNADGIYLDTGSNANRVDLSIVGASSVMVGNANAFQANLDDSDTAGVRLLVQGDGTQQQFNNNSTSHAAFDVLVDSNMTVSATIGEGPGVDPNSGMVPPPPLPIGDSNRFRNQSSGDAFVFNNNAAGTVNLDLRDNEATSAGGADFDLISGAGGTFNLVDATDTIAGANNVGTVSTTGTFNDIDPPVLQPTP